MNLEVTTMQTSTWTDAEKDFLRQNYGKMTYAQMAKHIPHRPENIGKKAMLLGVTKARGPQERSVPMSKALTLAQCDKMRSFLLAWLHYGKTYGRDISATRFLQAWRENECGYVYGSNRNKRVECRGR